MKFQQKNGWKDGYNEVVSIDGEYKDYLMDFGMLNIKTGDVFKNNDSKERAYVLVQGSVKFSWEGQETICHRPSYIDDNPWCLHVPNDVDVTIEGMSDNTEISVHMTKNDIMFASKLYGEKDYVIETRGKGTMNEAGTRIVRTILDKSISPDANLMLGEDVHYPGKWSGFPSHHHAQPEIYFYKFQKKEAFGLLRLGDDGVLLEDNDTVMIEPNLVHPQVTAPGYTMYYIWVIRHLKDNPYLKPVFIEDYLWLDNPDAKIWPEK